MTGASTASNTIREPRDGTHDFDFVEGRWRVHHTPAACRWEQAFSVDGGSSWETNWVMEFTRDA